ncbi:MAG: S41 family peptidase [Bacteroidota bacterium]
MQVSSFNLDGEKIERKGDLPDGWFKWGNPSEFIMKKDASAPQQGKHAIKVQRDPEAKGKASFGCAAYSFPAKYEGKKIELTGQMKIENATDGFVGLLLRIDGDSGPSGFDNMQSRGIQGTHGWKKYSIEIPYPEDAKKIYVGGILSGNGTAWFDDFDVLIDGVSVTQLQPTEGEKYAAQLDEEFDEGSNIDKIDLTPEKIQAIATLGKIWGFTKYYHPKIATGAVNWDYELFRVLPDYLQGESHKERALTVIDWIEKLGPIAKGERYQPDANLKIKADYSWFGETKWDELIFLLGKIRDTERTGKHYQLSFAPNIGNPKFKNESLYKQFEYPDVGFRLLALYRYWNMINYFFPYKHLTDEKWDQVLLDFVPRFVNAKDAAEYQVAMLELIGKVQDTHANIWRKPKALNTFLGNKISAVKVRMVEEQAFVVGFYDEEKGKASGLQFGDIITHVDGKSVEDLIQEKQPYLPASNYPTQLRDFVKLMLRTSNDQLNLTYTRQGKEQTTTVSTFPLKDINVWQRDQPESWKVLDGDIGYIYPGTLKEGDQQAIQKNLLSKKGLVIDLRCYPSEFIVFSLGNLLTPESANFVKFTQGSLQHPGSFSFTPPLPVGSQSDDYYQGKVAILIDESTQSQAEYTTMAFRTAPNNKVFGSTTAGADGNVSSISLPGNMTTMISGIGVYYPDGKETQRVGIVPDVEVKPTVKGMTNGRDEVLEKALKWINE